MISSSDGPSEDVAAWLGEVAVLCANRNFTVAGRTAVAGVDLEAGDGPFVHGSGPLVRGTTIVLTMAMAGRATCCDDLDGPGVPILRDRVGSTVT